MSWTIEIKDGVALVTMNTNKVNAQNPAFFKALHEAFDRLEQLHSRCAVVITGQGSCFSAGLDFDHHFPLFAKQDRGAVKAWFEEYRKINLRLLAYPRPTVAAINGHAYAGGLITALACDYRVAPGSGVEFSLNEIPIGIPMPSTYIELMRYAIGSHSTALMTLAGKVYGPAEAMTLGVLHEVCPPDRLIEVALDWARQTPTDCMEAYAFAKMSLQAPVLDAIHRFSTRFDLEVLPGKMTHASGLAAQRERFEQLKGRTATW